MVVETNLGYSGLIGSLFLEENFHETNRTFSCTRPIPCIKFAYHISAYVKIKH